MVASAVRFWVIIPHGPPNLRAETQRFSRKIINDKLIMQQYNFSRRLGQDN
jgi:hypothetical protein